MPAPAVVAGYQPKMRFPSSNYRFGSYDALVALWFALHVLLIGLVAELRRIKRDAEFTQEILGQFSSWWRSVRRTGEMLLAAFAVWSVTGVFETHTGALIMSIAALRVAIFWGLTYATVKVLFTCVTVAFEVYERRVNREVYEAIEKCAVAAMEGLTDWHRHCSALTEVEVCSSQGRRLFDLFCRFIGVSGNTALMHILLFTGALYDSWEQGVFAWLYDKCSSLWRRIVRRGNYLDTHFISSDSDASFVRQFNNRMFARVAKLNGATGARAILEGVRELWKMNVISSLTQQAQGLGYSRGRHSIYGLCIFLTLCFAVTLVLACFHVPRRLCAIRKGTMKDRRGHTIRWYEEEDHIVFADEWRQSYYAKDGRSLRNAFEDFDVDDDDEGSFWSTIYRDGKWETDRYSDGDDRQDERTQRLDEKSKRIWLQEKALDEGSEAFEYDNFGDGEMREKEWSYRGRRLGSAPSPLPTVTTEPSAIVLPVVTTAAPQAPTTSVSVAEITPAETNGAVTDGTAAPTRNAKGKLCYQGTELPIVPLMRIVAADGCEVTGVYTTAGLLFPTHVFGGGFDTARRFTPPAQFTLRYNRGSAVVAGSSVRISRTQPDLAYVPTTVMQKLHKNLGYNNDGKLLKFSKLATVDEISQAARSQSMLPVVAYFLRAKEGGYAVSSDAAGLTRLIKEKVALNYGGVSYSGNVTYLSAQAVLQPGDCGAPLLVRIGEHWKVGGFALYHHAGATPNRWIAADSYVDIKRLQDPDSKESWLTPTPPLASPDAISVARQYADRALTPIHETPAEGNGRARTKA